MIPYFLIKTICNKYLKNNFLHKPLDEILKDANKKTIYKKINSQKNEQITLDDMLYVFDHFNLKGTKTIFYFSGGSFMQPPSKLHINFVKKLAKKFNYHIVLVQYPLIADLNPLENAKLIAKIIAKTKYTEIILMGDSAGANLTLYILKNLQYKKIVKKIVLFSPWIDGHLNHEDISLIQYDDFILDKTNCISIANLVYKKYNHNNLYLCPNENDFFYSCKVLLISGEKEIFTPDAIKWTLSQTNLSVKHLVYKDMCHCFVLLPISLANIALKQVDIFLKN